MTVILVEAAVLSPEKITTMPTEGMAEEESCLCLSGGAAAQKCRNAAFL